MCLFFAVKVSETSPEHFSQCKTMQDRYKNSNKIFAKSASPLIADSIKRVYAFGLCAKEEPINDLISYSALMGRCDLSFGVEERQCVCGNETVSSDKYASHSSIVTNFLITL